MKGGVSCTWPVHTCVEEAMCACVSLVLEERVSMGGLHGNQVGESRCCLTYQECWI